MCIFISNTVFPLNYKQSPVGVGAGKSAEKGGGREWDPLLPSPTRLKRMDAVCSFNYGTDRFGGGGSFLSGLFPARAAGWLADGLSWAPPPHLGWAAVKNKRYMREVWQVGVKIINGKIIGFIKMWCSDAAARERMVRNRTRKNGGKWQAISRFVIKRVADKITFWALADGEVWQCGYRASPWITC